MMATIMEAKQHVFPAALCLLNGIMDVVGMLPADSILRGGMNVPLKRKYCEKRYKHGYRVGIIRPQRLRGVLPGYENKHGAPGRGGV